MSDVTMIGLGAMGSALARAFLRNGHGVSIWNRTKARMTPVANEGAVPYETAWQAVRASPVTVICIDNYDATRALIDSEGLLEALAGRTLVQLSTGTPAEARQFARWLNSNGIVVLDGAIMPYPEGIGADDAQILFSGPDDIYSRNQRLLGALGGDVRYVGAEIGAAAVLDMALLSHQLANYLGVWHGARVCESEGLGIDLFASLLPPQDPAAHLARRISEHDYDQPGATLEVWNAALDRILEQAQTNKINQEIPELISSLFRRAIALGHGHRDIATVIEVLRGTVST